MNQNNLLETASFTPRSLQIPNAWVGHLSFASWVIQEISPKIFVELGTHSGNSYFSFCQSVVEAGISSKCYAVDTWQGDEHAGKYNEETFNKVNAHHQEHYAGFSRLLRMTFDDAVSYFADESIELLHIDGLHTYEAVRHDFETWLPKLAPGAVVMFHDTNVREHNFGVWKLWGELQTRYPNNLEFVHSHGLGVLQLNNASDEKELHWLQPNSPEKQRLISYFAALGSWQLERFELIELKQRAVNLNQAVVERDGQIVNLNQAVAERDRAIQAVENSFSWRVTHPLRKAFSSASPLRIVVWRAAKLVWWTMTLQVGKKLREWRLSKSMKGPEKPHIAPPSNDCCFKVPFDYSIAPPSVVPSVAVVCHMYYPELLEEFKSYLANIPFSFDLFITTDTEQKKNDIGRRLLGWNKGAVEIRLAPNRGRDIAPKLITCRDVYERYEFFLHIHSKKSPQLDLLAEWRTYLLETLLGSEKIVASIFDAFKCDPKLGMIGPEHFDSVRGAIGWGWNFDAAKKFARELGIKLSLDGKIDFPSGSMFWGRAAALRPLLESRLTIEDFPPEAGQLDATLGHIVERLYYFVCEQAGYRWVKIVRPELLKNVERVIFVENEGYLKDLIKQNQYSLLVSNKEKSSVLSMLKNNLSSDAGGMTQSWRTVHAKSDLRDMEFSQFCDELEKHISKQESMIDFDEDFYLAANRDVAEEVAKGGVSCGYVHYCLAGQYEERAHSDRQLKNRFSINPSYPMGLFAPVGDRSLQPLRIRISLNQLPQSPQPVLLILFSHLQEDLFFAGYSEFFKDHSHVFDRFDRVIIAVESAEFDRTLALRYSSRIEVMHLSNIGSFKYKPDIIIGFNAPLTCAAYQMLPDNPERVVYYCQEFESGFFPYGADYIIGEKAIAGSHNLIVSTEVLRKFLNNRGLVNAQQVFVTRPRIEILDVPEVKTNRLFFYYRPESFNKRNLPDVLMDAVREFCYKYSGYEIYMVGSVATAYSFKINGTQVYIINKLPKKDYIELISSCDVVVSLIYAAHPGVIAYQAAASGIPTVTNVFENRDASLLKNISKNIMPYDPVRDDLLGAIEQALAMPKGQAEFDEALYSGSQQGALVDFYDNILLHCATENVRST
jgi:Rhamnan synthesis protein F/Methyltransferase domain